MLLSLRFNPQTQKYIYKRVIVCVKNTRSGLKLFLFLFSFWFIFLYSIFRTRVRVRVTRSHCHTAGHIRWHSHKSHDTWKDIEHSRRDNVIQCVVHMLTLRCTHGHLG